MADTSPALSATDDALQTHSEAMTLAVAAPVADLRREPDAASERVSQALLHTPAVVLEAQSEWRRVRLPDYEGWMAATQLARPAAPADSVAVVLAPRVRMYIEGAGGGDSASRDVFATTVFPVVGLPEHGHVRVALPGGHVGWLDANDGVAIAVRPAAEPFPLAAPETATALARQFLGTPYLWGGATIDGIDCSGFVQVCCRAAGRIIPRDADQQYEQIGYIVERGALQAGDLIFFAIGGAITHVAMMLDDRRYIHAKGRPDSKVIISSLDPDDAEYHAFLAAAYAGARRPFAERPPRAENGEDA